MEQDETFYFEQFGVCVSQYLKDFLKKVCFYYYACMTHFAKSINNPSDATCNNAFKQTFLGNPFKNSFTLTSSLAVCWFVAVALLISSLS